MSKGDQLVDKAANSLQHLADRAATQGGVTAKVAQELADDAAFLRKLKPSLIVARAKGAHPSQALRLTPTPGGSPRAPAR